MSEEPEVRPDRIEESVRLIDILAPLSLVTDLGMGQPPEEAMMSCLLATGLARRMGLPEPEVADVYYATLLKHLGCTATAHEEARYLGGDELAGRELARITDFARMADNGRLMANVGKGRGAIRRTRIVVGMLGGVRWGPRVTRAICEVGATMARRLSMSQGVEKSLYQMFERWDGKGGPQGVRGERILLPARFANVASQAVAFANGWGIAEVERTIHQRSGGWFDPGIVSGFEKYGRGLLEEMAGSDAMAAVVEAEPEPHRSIQPWDLDSVARAFADMVDLKSPHHHGHSANVADLASRGASALGLGENETRDIQVAALLHDLGRVGVPAGVWDKPAPLTTAEWEAVRLHPYHTERILTRSPPLRGVAHTASMHHERQDGSGYHRGVTAASIAMPARLLAAADAYQAMREDRAHRPALAADKAADRVLRESQKGRLDPDAVRAVCDAAGVPVSARREWPMGLSKREVEVLRLMATGLSNREIGRRLFISARTAEHHVQHIYAKIGASTRASAAMFAMEHDLVPVGAR
jgi:HD-GYP domain-containing protein (c-di-GMP phosphodiesterase class II)/DNA-binding CsgD family transcriptional regulator